MNLKTMKLHQLTTLHEQVIAVLKTKVADQRRVLESELANLDRLNGAPRAKSAGSKVRNPVAPKYRNPESPEQTWAGRGLRPVWLVAAIKSGKKLEDFAIAGSATSPKANVKRRARKTRK